MCLFLGQISHCFDYCSFVVLSEVWEGYTSCFVLFPQDCFGNSGSNFRIICSSFMKNVMNNLIQIELNLQTVLDSMTVPTILLPIKDHGLSFHFFQSLKVMYFIIVAYCLHMLELYSDCIYKIHDV